MLYGVLIAANNEGARELTGIEDPAAFFPGGKCTQISIAGGMILYYQKKKGAVMNTAATSLCRRMVGGPALVVSKSPINRQELFLRVEEKNAQAVIAAREAAAILKDGKTANGKGFVRGKMPADLQGQKLDMNAINQLLGE